MITSYENRFKEYVTGIAFSLTLSKPMCDAMEFCRLNALVPMGYRTLNAIPGVMTMQSLERRGLTYKTDQGPWQLTLAGNYLYPLLALAGLCRDDHVLMCTPVPARVA